ncbi:MULTISPECIES: MaoC/PaaZ C-terminal domain-containing protein [Burkholderia]|jgi:acyl dehydratase|uniref:Bifunctional protein PaaZ n=2 Tax=Burkholderia lata (strain ATCC 17760 / DSM 23089 / LMG 22485 / NCIMB 9086 / R18194 / 383) TaxID=482957 RepID=A0A833PYW0_BURL3|nr:MULTISPECIES: MaoC/PaaZ C-terminal domain-containing protein [Burkholderia]ABB06535.1 MaoC-like dehydratase [Burkholderia lata]KAF1040100.1 MAG: Bifunctional protein PaaZ [Burkholderia lata]MBN3768288.1 dehydratase [Burkholderia sp. Se-20378]MBN3776784.1 dehydratase [Burkholderia sp. Ac-20345]MBN3793784.1 dehydratase [Burkholderia sp. Ac-20392]
MSVINNSVNIPLDELEIGTKFRSNGRTVTESDVVMFCMFTGNWIEIHSNKEYASKTRWGERIVQGQLTFSLISGLLQFGPAIQANYGVDKMRFLNPVKIGDTVYASAEVIAKKEKDDKFGVGTMLIQAYNQRGEVLQRSEWSLLMLRKRADLDALIAEAQPDFKV